MSRNGFNEMQQTLEPVIILSPDDPQGVLYSGTINFTESGHTKSGPYYQAVEYHVFPISYFRKNMSKMV